MKVVIIGGGEVGYEVAKTLSEDKMDVTIVDYSDERVLKIQNDLDVNALCGNGARPQVLNDAGVFPGCDVDTLVACTNRDEVNILACQIARRCGVKQVITRTRGMEFTDTDEWARELGIDAMISPERSVEREIRELLTVSTAVHAAELLGGRAAIYAFHVADESPLADISLKQFRERYSDLIAIVVYIQREDANDIVPNGDTVMKRGDLCFVVTFRAQIRKLEELFQCHKSKPLKRVIIVGGGKIGFQVAHNLKFFNPSMDIRLIDNNRAKCEKISSELNGVLILHGDGADEKLLKKEGIDNVDGFVCATSNDELNLLYCLVAKSLGAKKCIAVVGRKQYSQIWDMLNVDAMVNPNEALASVILRYVRQQSGIKGLSILSKIDAEMIEMSVAKDSAAENQTLKDLPLPKGVLVALVARDSVFLPDGNTELRAGDQVLLFVATGVAQQAMEMFGVTEP